MLRRTANGLELVDIRDFQQTRQCDLELSLDAGSYIIVPRTTGCTLRPPQIPKDQQIRLMKKEKGQKIYTMHPLFEVTIEDIFNKHDMLM